jgi:hypothetical protein
VTRIAEHKLTCPPLDTFQLSHRTPQGYSLQHMSDP